LGRLALYSLKLDLTGKNFKNKSMLFLAEINYMFEVFLQVSLILVSKR
jgi:hypothetical protein